MATVTEPAKRDTIYYLHSAICLILMFGVGFLSPFGGITPLGMDVLGVFLGLLYGWIFVGFIWPSLIGMVALGLSDYASVLQVFQAGFGDATVLKIFFVLLFASILSTTDLTTYIANWCVSRSICKGRPWALTTLIFLGCIFIGGFINQFGGIVIMWYIFYSICQAAGFKRGDGYVGYMVVGIAVMCVMGTMALPFMPVSIIYRSMLQGDILSQFVLPMGQLIVYQLILLSLIVVGYLVLGKWILRLDVSPLLSLDDQFYQTAKEQKMNKEQLLAMISLVIFIVILLAPSILPDSQLKALLTNLDIIGASILIISFFCFRRNGKTPIYNFGRLITTGINWDLIILFAATMPISAAMESSDTGIVSTVVGALMPIFSQISPSLFLVFCLIIFIVITQVAHNVILAIVFTPVLAAIGIDMGINPFMFQILFAYCLQLAFMTPGASANAAMVFGNTEWLTTKDAYKFTACSVLVGTILIVAIGIPIGFLLF